MIEMGATKNFQAQLLRGRLTMDYGVERLVKFVSEPSSQQPTQMNPGSVQMRPCQSRVTTSGSEQ